MGPEQQVAELGVGEKNDEEHDSEAQDVLGAAGQRGGELGHGFVEADVLEYLDPGKEEVDGVHVVVLCLPEGEELEVGVHVWLLQELPHQPIHLESAEYVEAHSHNGEQDDHQVQNIPDAAEVAKPVDAQLQDLLHHVVEDEDAEDDLTANDKEVPGAHVADQLNRADLPGWDGTSGSWKLHHQSQNTEKIDVGIVD